MRVSFKHLRIANNGIATQPSVARNNIPFLSFWFYKLVKREKKDLQERIKK